MAFLAVHHFHSPSIFQRIHFFTVKVRANFGSWRRCRSKGYSVRSNLLLSFQRQNLVTFNTSDLILTWNGWADINWIHISPINSERENQVAGKHKTGCQCAACSSCTGLFWLSTNERILSASLPKWRKISKLQSTIPTRLPAGSPVVLTGGWISTAFIYILIHLFLYMYILKPNDRCVGKLCSVGVFIRSH